MVDLQASKKCLDLIKTHSPLMMAVELKNMDVLEKLIELDASMAFKNKVSWS